MTIINIIFKPTKPMKLNKDDRREEMAAYGTIILISVVLTLIIAAIISNLLN